MRSFRRELVSVVTVLSLSIAILLAFPRGAFSHRLKLAAPAVRTSSAAFITLTSGQEEEALRRAKSTWHFADSSSQAHLIRLSLSELPEEEAGPLLPEISIPAYEVPPAAASAPLPAWTPSEQANALEPLSSEVQEKTPLAFAREELLKLNSND